MTSEELDALDALRQCATQAPWPSIVRNTHLKTGQEQWAAEGPAHNVRGYDDDGGDGGEDAEAEDAARRDAGYLSHLVNAAPRLLAEARQAAILRAKLAESERHAKLATEGANLIPRAVHLALASVFGRGAEDRDPVQLASDVVAEVYSLRAKLIESETWRTELRAEMDAVKGKLREVTGQRDEPVKLSRDAVDVMSRVDPMDYSGARRRTVERLTSALEAAR